jgi:hypothetical protein
VGAITTYAFLIAYLTHSRPPPASPAGSRVG